MIIILFLFLVAIIIIAFRSRLKRVRYKRANQVNYSSNIDEWMDMKREERDIFVEQEKKTSLMRKKVLLDQIRKEYRDLIQARGKS